MESEVCDLKYALKLKELGFDDKTFETFFEWGYHGDTLMLMPANHKWPQKDNGGLMPCPTYTVGQLGGYLFSNYKTGKAQWGGFESYDSESKKVITDYKEANVRAQILIDLLLSLQDNLQHD